jgi:glycosyltransferase involved in cell wall biosynthesis
MRNRISALFIDPHKSEHDYSKITIDSDYEFSMCFGERGFDITVITDTSNILTELNKVKGVDCIVTVGQEDEIDFVPLNALSFEFRKKWIHIFDFNPYILARRIIEVFLYNINREREQEVKLFSIFTCTFNTSRETFERLYNSLKRQTYHNWNWYILDDSTNPAVAERIEKYHDPRIILFKNVTNHGNIGFNKHMIASACDGDYLVEVDHDDELTPDCLELLLKAFTEFPDTDFVYSYAMEFVNGHEVYYSDGFAYGLGEYKDLEVNGVMRHIALTADVNALSVRGIHALPNHVRCWEKNFYHKIGGHNIELSVLDDMDILIRTFLYGKMTKIDKVLYIQHEGENQTRRDGTTAQSKRFDEIQRTNDLLRKKYDKQIHDRLISLGVKDPFWINETFGSSIRARYDKPLPILNHILHV